MALTQVNSNGVKDNSIVNADIKSDAAIEGTKIAPDFGSQNIATTGQIQATAQTPAYFKRAVSGTSPVGVHIGNNDRTWALEAHSTKFSINDHTNTNTERFLIDNNGKVGIGDPTPTTALEIHGHNQVTFGSMPETIISYGTTSAYDSGSAGSGINLGGRYNASENTLFGGVHGVKENTTINNYAGALVFSTRPNGGNSTEKVRIDSSGRVLLGTTDTGDAAADDLVIGDGQGNRGLSIRAATDGWSSIYFADGTSSSANYMGIVAYDHTNDALKLYSNGWSATPDVTINSTGTLEIGDGDLKIGTAGHGIDFSAVSHASGMTSETLDSYEEGTFTPTDASGNSITLTMESGCRYTKIGNQVHIECDFTIATNSVSANTQFTSLPFVPVNYSGGVVNWTQLDESLVTHAGSANGGSIWIFKGEDSDTGMPFSVLSNKRVIFALTYTTT